MEKTILMETNRLDDDSVVVNFNLFDKEADEVVGDGGYVNIRQEENEYAIFVFNSEGDIVSEVRVPFAFKTFAD
jgi:hypothetical protein